MRVLLPALLVVAACRPPQRWLVVDVRSAGAPVAGATVAAVCPPYASDARVSGDDGHAELEMEQKAGASCTITAEREGLRTARAPNVALCRDRATCAPVEIDLEAP
jgi:hypothetical protein